MAKLLITLIFLYQNALVTQLGITILGRSQYVFTQALRAGYPTQGLAGDLRSQPNGDQIRVLTPEDSAFTIPFIPLVLGHKYKEVRAEIKRIVALRKSSENGSVEEYGTDLLDEASSRRVQTFAWEKVTGRRNDGATSLVVAEFNLNDLIKKGGTLSNGDYQIKFSFTFYDMHGRPMPSETAHDYVTVVRYVSPEELVFGDLPVVQGRPFPIPDLLRQRIARGANLGEMESYQEPGGGSQEGSILTEDWEHGLFTPSGRLQPGHTYEQRGFLLEDRGEFFGGEATQVRVEFVIRFLLLRNEPPRATYIQPGDDGRRHDPYTVLLYYTDYFHNSEEGYYYFNLSRYIIDPDGVTDGVPDVRVKSLSLGQTNRPYRLVRRKDGDWHLIVNGPIRNLMRPGERHELSIVASDEHTRQPIKVVIVRRQ